MKLTNRQTSRRTLTDFYRALDHKHAITITYLDHDGAESVRTIETQDIRTTKNGHIEIRALCRLRGEARQFDLARIVSYTVHRSGYTQGTTPAKHGIVVRSTNQLIARELGRDYCPRTPINRTDAALAA